MFIIVNWESFILSLIWEYLLQLHRSLHRFVRLTQSTRISSLLKEWNILRNDVPKGFEKYFPTGKKGAQSKTPPKTAAKGSWQCRRCSRILVGENKIVLMIVFPQLCYLDQVWKQHQTSSSSMTFFLFGFSKFFCKCSSSLCAPAFFLSFCIKFVHLNFVLPIFRWSLTAIFLYVSCTINNNSMEWHDCTS